MGKKVYRVKKGDDFFKISRKLYGDPSYAMDLMRANAGFNRVGPGMVLRLPKRDPRITRERKMKRRRKLYGEPKDPLGQSNLPLDEEGLSEIDRLEMEYSEDPGAAISQGGESLDWWDDPAFEDELVDLIVETAEQMGMDEDVMLEELGLGIKPDTPQTQSQQAGEIPGETDKTSGSGAKEFKPAEPRPADDEWDEPSYEKPQTTPQQPDETQQPASTISIQDVRDEDMLAAWYEEQIQKAGGDSVKIRQIELARLDKREELQEKELGRPAERKDVVQLGTVEIQKSDDESTNDWRIRSKKIMEDYEYLVYYGLKEGGVFYPEGNSLTHSGFGNEFEYWDPYYIPWAERNVAQNMSPHRLVSDEIENSKSYRLKDSYNANLCGQLAVIAALGIDLEVGMNIFAELTLRGFDQDHYRKLDDDPYDGVVVSTGYDILHKDFATTVQTILDFIKKAGGEEISAKLHRTGEEPIDTPENFAENLASGNIVIACVNIDTTQNGQLMSMEKSSEDVAHWVWVQDIITTKDNETLVRVYNPYMNREEVYDWATFSDAYKETTNESDNIALVASFNNPNQ